LIRESITANGAALVVDGAGAILATIDPVGWFVLGIGSLATAFAAASSPWSENKPGRRRSPTEPCARRFSDRHRESSEYNAALVDLLHGEHIQSIGRAEDTIMFTKTKIAPSAALILGAASAALANDSGENHQDGDRGSVAGVNHLT